MSSSSHFSPVAREYATFRPGYPPDLFAWLAEAAPGRDAVWDCGCGSGQASVGLAEHFAQVWATDVSAEQIAAARPHARIRYTVAPAERSGLDAASVDLVTVAQALHWFDVPAFYAEATRVARPGAVIAVWTYPLPQFANAKLDALLFDFYERVVGPYWPPERRHVEAGYRTLPFPFEELPHPDFGLDLDWDLDRLMGYLSSWSATSRYRQQRGTDPLPELRMNFEREWPTGVTAQVRMPIVLRAGALRPGRGLNG